MKKLFSMLFTTVFLLSLCLVVPVHVSAAFNIYYVSGVDGNDGYDGLSSTHSTENYGPFATISYAVGQATDGDTIIVMDVNTGDTMDYYIAEAIVIDKSLTIKAEVSSDTDQVVLEAAYYNPPGKSAESVNIFEVTADNVTIEGLTFTEVSEREKYAIYLNEADYCTIIGNNVIGTGKVEGGIQLYYSDYCKIIGNTFHNNYWDIYLHESNYNIISGNIITGEYMDLLGYHPVSGISIIMDDNASNNTVSCNTFEDNSYCAVISIRSENNTISCNNFTLNLYIEEIGSSASKVMLGIHVADSNNNTVSCNSIISNVEISGYYTRGIDISECCM